MDCFKTRRHVSCASSDAARRPADHELRFAPAPQAQVLLSPRRRLRPPFPGLAVDPASAAS